AALAKRKAKGKPDPDPYEQKTGPGTWATADTTAMWLDKPIVVLTNRLSYSATNFFAGFMSQLPQVTIIGDRSGGGGGIPVSYELPNGWKFRLSASRTYLLDGQDIETGIEPDIYQGTGPEDEIKGVDAIIERAKVFIVEQTE
ncbi:MAG: S41 family peptidase, partial [Bacteroidota bacterium]